MTRFTYISDCSKHWTTVVDPIHCWTVLEREKKITNWSLLLWNKLHVWCINVVILYTFPNFSNQWRILYVFISCLSEIASKKRFSKCNLCSLNMYMCLATNTKGVEIIPFNITTVRKYTQQVKDYKKNPFVLVLKSLAVKISQSVE